jgi:hypothetical protein
MPEIADRLVIYTVQRERERERERAPFNPSTRGR